MKYLPLALASGILAVALCVTACNKSAESQRSRDAELAKAVFKAMASKGRREAHWLEEVKIQDGRIVQLERRAAMIGDTLLNPTGGRLDGTEFVYRPLNAKWKSAPRTAGWVLAFDIVDGVPYAVIDGAGWEYCRDHGPDSYDVTLLKWANSAWIRMPEAAFPLSRLTQNVSMDYWGNTAEKDASGVMTWQAKAGKDFYPSGEPQRLMNWLNQRRRKCGQTLPHLFASQRGASH